MLLSVLKNLFRHPHDAHALPSTGPRRVHLGCGKDIRQGWINVDARSLPGVDVVANLDDCRNTALPFGDDSIDEFFGSHVLEHLRDSLAFMQELHRVAKPNAVAVFRVPYGSSDDADEDPTHVRRYFLNSFHYFSQLAYRRADYGYRGDWEVDHLEVTVDASRQAGKSNEQLFEEIRSRRNVVTEMIATLKAVKPVRVPGSEQAKNFRVVIKRVAEAKGDEQR